MPDFGTHIDGDLALVWDAAACAADAAVVANDLQGDAGLETAVLLSLFLDRRAEDGDIVLACAITDALQMVS